MESHEKIGEGHHTSTTEEMFSKEIWDKIHTLTKEGKFNRMIEILNSIPDIEERVQFCSEALTALGTLNAIDKYGDVKIYDNREEYERAKSKLSGMQAKAILYENENGEINATQILDFVPEYHPLKLYYEKLLKEELLKEK